ncbi:MAG TPA: sigma-70 family RNA polymerase sigma factor [Blastocatellia bacterium]|jgi:RNA polymerase sigma-70 factor (ECF subfamily)
MLRKNGDEQLLSSQSARSFTASAFEETFRAHERFIWGLCYRMTGNAADADDLAQETFVRAWERPPARTGEPLRPWLVSVAVNLSRDLLRRRKRRRYEGPWLPSPIDTGDEVAPPSYEPVDEEGNPAARYDMLESVSFAFLLALEALTPAQRAVLLLRDVFDYSVKETAGALGMSEPNVKTTHHRARRATRDYDRERRLPTRSLQEQTRRVMERFLQCLFNRDAAGVEALLAEDARHLGDGGGEFLAARSPVIGRKKVALFNLRLAELKPEGARSTWRMFNGLPAIVTELARPPENYAPFIVTTCELDGAGAIKRIFNVLATRKLTAVRKIEITKVGTNPEESEA